MVRFFGGGLGADECEQIRLGRIGMVGLYELSSSNFLKRREDIRIDK